MIEYKFMLEVLVLFLVGFAAGRISSRPPVDKKRPGYNPMRYEKPEDRPKPSPPPPKTRAQKNWEAEIEMSKRFMRYQTISLDLGTPEEMAKIAVMYGRDKVRLARYGRKTVPIRKLKHCRPDLMRFRRWCRSARRLKGMGYAA